MVEFHSFFASDEEPAAKFIFQVVDGAGNCRLAGHQNTGSPGQVAVFGNIVKHFVVFKVQVHFLRILLCENLFWVLFFRVSFIFFFLFFRFLFFSLAERIFICNRYYG